MASRLEELNKECESDILISSTAAEACAGMIEVACSFDLQVRGRSDSILAFEVVGRARGD